MALEGSAGAEEAALFHRKIEFHLARKQFKGFGNSSDDNGFKLVTLNPNASEPQKASASGNKSERSEARFDPELSFRITFRRIGAGLRNLGNTCFLNSVLQCLTYTEPLAAYLQSGKHQSSCRTAGFCALCAIQKHVSRALQSSGRILEPKDLVSNLRCISRNFRNARQEDAHEYMVNLLESMHKCCLPSGVPSESPSAYEKSLVHKIFGGRLRSQVKCMQCSYCSDKFDPFLDLSLEIARADSLYKALNHFTATEQLDGGAKQYQCQQCKQKVRALKQLTVYKAPNVLAIHLKRFGSHVQGQKINKNVAFRPNLDLKPFVTGPSDGDLKYTLYGVLVHAGWSTHSGHYYCFIRTSSGMWYSLDDNQVYQVSEKRVLEQKAYMLFYVRDGVNVCTMKPVDVHHKENMVANGTPIAVHTKLNPDLRLKTQNGLVERRLDGSSSADLSKDAPPRTAPMKNPSNGNPFEHANSSVAGHCSDKRYPLSEPPLVVPPAKVFENCSTTATNSVVPPAKFLENSSTGVANSVGHQAAPNSTSEASGSAHVSSHDTTIADCNYRVIGGEDVNDNRADKIQSDPAQSSLSSHEPCTASRKMRNIGGSNLELSDGKAVPAGTVEASSNICCLKSSKKRTIEECQVVDSPRSGNSTPEAGLRMSQDELTTTEQFPCATAKNKRPQLKLKRKHFMYQVSGMPLSSNIIFGAAFSMQKKQKRRKYQSLLNKSENLKSGSETAKKVKCGSDDDEKRIGIRNASRNEVISGKDINNGPRQRPRPKTDSTVVLSEKPQNTRDPVAQAPDCSENHWRESGKANTWSILTRGLDETTIARWDDIEISHSEKAESRKEQIIGYIGDEWDEEYDTGKRKKIKSTKISFDGPNLFQVIATNKNANRIRATLL